MDRHIFTENILELIRRTSVFLSADVAEALAAGRKLEQEGSRAAFALDLVLHNIGMAKQAALPICQDTGLQTFYIKHPVGFNTLLLEKAIIDAVVTATEKGFLRQNSVDSLTGKNSGTNTGPGSPAIHAEAWEQDFIDIRMIQKGGGSENVSAQYSLPASIQGKKCGRDLAGVRACILDALHHAQGKGCSPGFIGVCVGGDRAAGYDHAKQQMLRPTDDVNSVPELAELEARILTEANQLDIGPMGFGGKTTLLSCKIGCLNRVPASFFVTTAYMCWAFRRRGVALNPDGTVREWLYQAPGEFERPVAVPRSVLAASALKKIMFPALAETIRSLVVGDVVLVSGTIFTGRDAVHKYLAEGGELDAIRNGVIYHCGPIMIKEGGGYRTLAAGPTTSIREEPYQAKIIEKFGVQAVIGKGGMGAATLEALKKQGAVYLHAVGGAAQVYAQCVKKVGKVYLSEFGSPEAVWELAVEDFPAVVTMDSHGYSLHMDIMQRSTDVLRHILK
ncbi:MAG: fumarate hydratase [Candidatus Raymondbacteria bacterium RifOxyA12_full_50_37]|nr:MAG: fumarate hydratase [Candidatus Raymondbacteria bacterium RIFOXYA2_FULL_49_16]OGJ91678.1 MAG: fumarate hydratase [Candidatus Raymondbacteria bacterium RifOxyA12_full_50_37]OGJ95211.1 MAG: fumarate hydratase [Candidatus Raymondbacteria bacterium RIFOXYC2_FULL_50_21]OGP39415.1 MAG: fumarate hydratase [Candidatus Raymondbacteria bacterium RIFOXYB2_FULL_49_35]